MRPSGFCLLLLLLALTFFLPLFSLSRGVAGAAPALTTKRERLYTVTGEAFTADGFAIYRLNGGDSSSLYFPTIYRARPGIRDLAGLNTVQFPSTQGSDIVTIRLGGLLTAVTFGNNQNDDSPSWSSMQELILARTYPLDGEAERGNLVVIEGEYYLGTTTTPITQNDNLKRDFQWSPTDDISYLETTPEGRTDLWIAPAGTVTPTIVLTDVEQYRWSPNGDAIAFTANRDGDTELFVSAPDGSGITALTDNHAEDELFDWVTGGNELLVRRTDGTHDDMWLIRRTGESEVLFLNQTERNVPLARSPDGYLLAHLAYAADGSFEFQVSPTIAPPLFAGEPLWVCPPDPDCFVEDVAWSPDGSGLAWRGSRENPTTNTYETLLLYSENDFTTSQVVTHGDVPVGRPVWATGTEWLIFAATTSDTPATTNLFATDTTFGTPSALVQLSSGELNMKPTDWREVIRPTER